MPGRRRGPVRLAGAGGRGRGATLRRGRRRDRRSRGRPGMVGAGEPAMAERAKPAGVLGGRPARRRRAPAARLGSGELRGGVRPPRAGARGHFAIPRPGAQHADRSRRDHRAGGPVAVAGAMGAGAGGVLRRRLGGEPRETRAGEGRGRRIGRPVRRRRGGAGGPVHPAPVAVRHRRRHAGRDAAVRLGRAPGVRAGSRTVAPARARSAGAGVRAARREDRAGRRRRGGGARRPGRESRHPRRGRYALPGAALRAGQRHGRAHRALSRAGQRLALPLFRGNVAQVGERPRREPGRRGQPAAARGPRSERRGARRARQLAHRREPGAGVPGGRRDRSRLRGRGARAPRADPGAGAKPRRVSGPAHLSGRPDRRGAARRPPGAALAARGERRLPRLVALALARRLGVHPFQLRPGAAQLRRRALRGLPLSHQGLPLPVALHRAGAMAGAASRGRRDPP